MTEHRQVWVAFDFDGTLTHGDTLMPFLRYALGSVRWARALAMEAPSLVGYLLRLVPNNVAKERLLVRCLKGMPVSELGKLGEEFANERISGMLRPETMARLLEHRQSGHTCVLVSASLGAYLKPWAQVAGFHYVLCTEVQQDGQGLVSGKLEGVSCFGPEKARRLGALLPGNIELHAYGDSRGDLEMLAMAQCRWYRGQMLNSHD